MTKIVADESMECCTYLNWNPVLLGRHFQYQVKIFFQVIFIDGRLGKKKYHAIRVEFQVRGSSNVHSFLSITDAPVLMNIYNSFMSSSKHLCQMSTNIWNCSIETNILKQGRRKLFLWWGD